jgi:hypothetical protein
MPIADKVQLPDVPLQWDVAQEGVTSRKILIVDLCPKRFLCRSNHPLEPWFARQEQAIANRTFADRHSDREVRKKERPWVSIGLGVPGVLDRNPHVCAVAPGIVSKRSIAKQLVP